ncbi:hypothetical protein NS365_18130 [Aureimonas ureilytica]|uniref:GtrA/DPMS transmembrane domain-containing protein n=1 Tax=Aureimonas ureilytica TaxID=401562 RepID=A0A175RIM6_9HYPH|nr:GtrA family protein [Aureimonas ureilytica]KTR03516.1 hypothetical protein NS365_18130 [Aureimonas ureilytica]
MIRSALTGEIGRFLIVGALSTVVNYSVFYGLILLGIDYIPAAAGGFLIGVAVGYSLNKSWTFGVSAPSSPKLVASYWLVYGISLICGLLFIRGLVELLNFDPRIANLAAIVLTTCTNFLGTRFFVFRR